MVFFGGDQPTYGGDVWTLSLAEPGVWTRLSPAGEPPDARSAAAAVYDPVRNRMIVFGGVGSRGFLDEVWALSLSGEPTWSRVFASGESPPGRVWHSAIFDPVGDRMIVFGGAQGFYLGAPRLNDTWALSLSGTPAWSRIEPLGILPPDRYGNAVYIPERQAMLVLDGSLGGPYLNDVWELSLADPPRWTQVSASGTAPRGEARFPVIYDSAERCLVAVGLPPLGSVWSLSLDGGYVWHEWPARCDVPPHPWTGQAIYDPMRRRLVLYQGSGTPGVWALSLDEDPTWSELPAPHSSPSARWTHSAVYDPVRQQMVVFGGVQRDTNPPYVSLSDETWALALRGQPRWRRLEPSGTRPRGQGHVAIFDARRDRMLVFGLCDQTRFGGIISVPPTCSNEVWSLSFSNGPVWSRLSASGEPPDLSETPYWRWKAAIEDPARDRMVVLTRSGTPVLHALSLAENPVWTPIVPTGEVPTSVISQ